MAFGYRYTLERQENGWTLVRFPGIPEALTEGASEEEESANALGCVIAALEGYMKASRPLPRWGRAERRPSRSAALAIHRETGRLRNDARPGMVEGKARSRARDARE